MALGARILVAGLLTVAADAAVAATAGAQVGSRCAPTPDNRPVCPRSAPPETANFVDETVRVASARHISLEGRVYVGPFAELIAARGAPIDIGEESNVQDNVSIYGAGRKRSRDDDEHESREGHKGKSRRHHGRKRSEGYGYGEPLDPGVEIGERVILAHGATVIGPARLGMTGGPVAANLDEHSEVFVSFNAEVDGATLERNTQVSALARVGPGVVLRSGTVVLPGKNVDTQREADDPSLGKVRALTVGDVVFAEAVIEVNVALAREYSRLASEARSNVRGINFDPGNTPFNPDRDLPRAEAETPEPGPEFEACTGGRPIRVPGFRNRIIGEVCLADPLYRLSRVQGDRIALRADEGEPLSFGHIRRMGDDVIAHALEETTVVVGDDVTYGEGSVIHGGGRRVDGSGRGVESTFVGDGVRLGALSVTFRSLVGDRSRIGHKSAVVSSELAPGTRIPDRTIYVNNAVFGPVEW
jgi:carbonic anhydrase/acetyltransferase-like protein (isoleucine patch superfamily)